ncbi:MAG: hypothetical protein ACJ8HQ_02045 [Chthoniobacterales bacterium]
MPTDADANVVYSGAINSSVPATVTGEFINLTTFQVGLTYAAVNGGNTSAPALNLWGTSAFRAWLYPTASAVNRFVSVGANPAELVAGAVINAASTFGTTTMPSALVPGGAWVGGTTGYLGFKFLSGALTLYGWAQIFVPTGTPSSTNQMVLIDMAFENSGAGILAGQQGNLPSVPDSSNTLLLLAVGCAATGALAWRRRTAAV